MFERKQQFINDKTKFAPKKLPRLRTFLAKVKEAKTKPWIFLHN